MRTIQTITKEELSKIYINDKLSTSKIANMFGCVTATVLKYMELHGIKRRTISEATKGLKRTPETCRKISESRKGCKNPNFGKKCKVRGKRCWYICKDGSYLSFRSQWEAYYAEYLDDNNIQWLYEPETFTLSDGSAYTPDFYLPHSQSYTEVKGWLTDRHKKQLAKFSIDYPHIELTLADRSYLINLGIDLQKKWINSNPQIACVYCGKSFHPASRNQMFCNNFCKNRMPRLGRSKSLPKSPKFKRCDSQMGELNNNSKLSVDEVIKVKTLYSQSQSQATISKILNISAGQVSNIVNGKTWSHIKI